MAKQIALLNSEQKHSSILPDLTTAVVGDLVSVVQHQVVLTESQANALFAALQNRVPGGVALESFSAIRKVDGTAEVSFRGLRLVKPVNLLNAVKTNLAHGIAGEVVDV